MSSVFEYFISVIIKISVAAVFGSILIDFLFYNKKMETKRERRSIVATGSMTAFYLVYYALLKFSIGRISKISYGLIKLLIIIGTLMVVTGAIINILGRLQLKGNWANHIKIYKNHSLVTKGVYGYVRHPLYSSIILMLYGGSIIYYNWLSAVLVSIIFIPSMVYRAKQEEQLLKNEFSEYEKYQKKVGLFFPKTLRRYGNERI